MLEPPVHPMDDALHRRGWRRAQLADLGNDRSNPLAARIICRNLKATPLAQTVLVIVDVNLWLHGGKVRMDIVTQPVPPILELLARQGRAGVSVHGLGLIPCDHTPWHWNPFCLPLVWQPEMDSRPHFDALAKRYNRMLEDTTWQCPDAARIMTQH